MADNTAAPYPVVLQVLPALGGGGVERGTVEIAAAVAQAGGGSLVASAGGRLANAIERAGARNIPLAARCTQPMAHLAQRRAPHRGDSPRARRHRARPFARTRLVSLARRAAHRRALRHHLSRRLPRGFSPQAPLQRGDGARRNRHRRQPLHRRARARAARRRSPRIRVIPRGVDLWPSSIPTRSPPIASPASRAPGASPTAFPRSCCRGGSRAGKGRGC